MWFKSDEHEKVYTDLKSRAQANNREFLAAIYVLSAINKDMDKYICSKGIRFQNLFEDFVPWSSGEKALVKLAATLFNAAVWSVLVHDVFSNLDRDNLRIALEAVRMRYFC